MTEEIDEVIGKFKSACSILTQETQNIQKLMDTKNVMSRLTYHDMYRQSKADTRDMENRLNSLLELRELIVQHGYVRTFRRMVHKERKYVESWERIRNTLKEEMNNG